LGNEGRTIGMESYKKQWEALHAVIRMDVLQIGLKRHAKSPESR